MLAGSSAHFDAPLDLRIAFWDPLRGPYGYSLFRELLPGSLSLDAPMSNSSGSYTTNLTELSFVVRW
jgi:hypothetical protein